MKGWLEERVPSLRSSGRTVFQVSVPAALEALKPERAQHEKAWGAGEVRVGGGQRAQTEGDGGNRLFVEIGLVRWNKNDW